MTYKALITDLDGTALPKGSDGSDISHSLTESVAKAKQQDVKIACATGREWRLVKPIVDILGITEPCIVEGGTRIVGPATEKTLWSHPLDTHAIDILYQYFTRYSDDALLSYKDAEAEPMRAMTRDMLGNPNFMYLLGVPVDKAIELANVLNELQDDFVAHITPSWRGEGYDDVHVTHTLADKEHAVKQWLLITGATSGQTIGIGDSGNDIPIFQSVGLKVAVGNATDSLKQLADYIAPPQSEGALEHVINKFIIRPQY